MCFDRIYSKTSPKMLIGSTHSMTVTIKTSNTCCAIVMKLALNWTSVSMLSVTDWWIRYKILLLSVYVLIISLIEIVIQISAPRYNMRAPKAELSKISLLWSQNQILNGWHSITVRNQSPFCLQRWTHIQPQGLFMPPNLSSDFTSVRAQPSMASNLKKSNTHNPKKVLMVATKPAIEKHNGFGRRHTPHSLVGFWISPSGVNLRR